MEEELKDKQVTDIYVTHMHPDHFGYSGGLQKKTGARVSMPEIDAKYALQNWEEESFRRSEKNYQMADMPEDLAEKMMEGNRAYIPWVTPYPEINHYFEEGEIVKIGKLEYEVIFTPGHSDGLIVFYNKEKSVLLSTDHILPKISPNVKYWFRGEPDPLGNYFNSLEKVKKLDAEVVIPSHREPFIGANKRIDELLKHHEERLEITLGALTNGGRTIYEVCKVLFPHIKTFHDIRFAAGETIAHLEYLRHRNHVTRDIVNGKYIYYKK